MMLLPNFEEGNILKKPMLEALRDIPENYIQTIYSQYGEGIIEGLDIIINENKLSILPGVFKLNGEIFISSDEISTSIKEGKHYVYLCVEKFENEDNCGTNLAFELKIVDCQLNNGIEICTYAKNSDGLLKHYQDFSEIKNTMNRINMLNTKYSIKKGYTLSPEIFILFAHEMLKKDLNAKDMAFAVQCLNSIPSLELLKQMFNFDELLENEVLFSKMQNYLRTLSSLKNTEITEKVIKKHEGMML